MQIQLHAQNSFRASVPCNDSLILSIKGKYKQDIATNIGYFSSVPPAAAKEMKKRLQSIQQLVQEAIPQPLGLEAKWKMMGGNYRFAHDLENQNGFQTHHAVYMCGFFYYDCWGDDPNYVAYSGETSTWLTVDFNGGNAPKNALGQSEHTTINGLPVYQLFPVVEKWKGYELLTRPGSTETGGNNRYLLVHRKDEQPYLPISRKQYLEEYQTWITKFFEEMIEWMKNEPDQLQIYKKLKTDLLSRWQAEFNKSKSLGLLDSPAVIREWHSVLTEEPIFVTAAEGGGRLVTENPAYFRRGLPKYNPQLIWVQWSWNNNAAGMNFRKMIEENFMVEKLQAMIDK